MVMSKLTNSKLLIVLLLCCIFNNCLFAQITKIDSSKMVTLRIDPSTAVGAPVSQIFEEVEFIPLETTKESLFGSISQLEILDNKYVLFDYDTKAVLIFSLKGKYINKISANKLPVGAGNEKNEPYGFHLQKLDGKSYISIYTHNGELYFDSNGTFVKKKEKNRKDIFDRFEVGTEGNYYRESYQKNDQDSIGYELALFNKDTILGLFLQFSTNYGNDQFMSAGDRSTYNANTKELFYVHYYNYNIYKGTPEGLSLAYKLIFPFANTLPKDFLVNPIYKNKRYDYFRDHNKIIYGLGNVLKIGDMLVFKIGQWGGIDKTILSYNLKTGELLSLNDLEPDAKTSFLPITDGGVGYDFKNMGFILNKDGYLYTSYSSLAMSKFKELSTNKKPVYNEVLETYFKTQSPKNNPVIIKLKPKQN
jgi:hypothetical protein